MRPIGHITSSFKEKFGTPRANGLAPDSRGTIVLLPEFASQESLKGLDTFSHLWIIFIFHQSLDTPWRPLVRPPRLGGNQKMGVFATRSPIRPNPIGLSVVEIESIEHRQENILIHIKGLDIVDGTPILDIKPYIPKYDSLPNASNGWIDLAPPIPQLEVCFNQISCEKLENKPQYLKKMIEQILAQDPRPSYKEENEDKIYANKIENFDIKWSIRNGKVEVLDIENI